MQTATRPHRRSLIWKIFLSVFLCVVLLLGVNLLLNTFALSTYYRHEKVGALEDAFAEIDALYAAENTEQLKAGLRQISSERGISVTIWNGRQVVYQDRPDDLRDLFRFDSYLPEAGDYVVQRNDDRADSRQIRLVGRLHNGLVVSMLTPITAIEEGVSISNRFLLLSGGITLLFGAVAVWVVARSITRPVRRLSELADRAARLDFSQRYTLHGADELDALGSSINRMSDTLSQTIGDLQVANARLREDNQRQQQQNEARRAFIANVSHELKTPLALIQTYAEGLHEGIADDTQRTAYCEVIEDESQKMSGLIRKMTALMQLEDGSEQLTPERFDLCELVRNLLTRYQPECERRHLTVTAPPDAPVWVRADDYLIENVLTNYLANALHHVPDGGEIRLFFAAAPEERVRLSVYNSGSHIPPDEQPRIWESFYKVDKARTRAYGGSGIGLSLVAAIMRAHGMPYGVYDHPDGVEFYLELPQA